MIAKSMLFGTIFVVAGSAIGQTLPPNNLEIQVGQSIADIFRSASGSDLALVASGFLSPTKDTKNLADTFQFPTDELWLVSLTGKQLLDAFDRSLAFFPEPCPDMLYFSGAEVTFQSGKSVKTKVVGVTVSGSNIDPAKTYKVSMPASLARGGLSYFAVWNFQKPEKVISPAIEKLLTGKSVQTSTVRWLSRQSL
jgi:2',3'-cyclic-nucleotide 2'-phosphodiesterase (5'-nucleotidase family)